MHEDMPGWRSVCDKHNHVLDPVLLQLGTSVTIIRNLISSKNGESASVTNEKQGSGMTPFQLSQILIYSVKLCCPNLSKKFYKSISCVTAC